MVMQTPARSGERAPGHMTAPNGALVPECNRLGRHMTSLLEHISLVTEAASIEELWALHVDKMRGYGFDRFIYGFTRFRTRHSFGSLDDILILSNHSTEYLDGFLKSGLYYHAPMVNWAAY